MNRTRFFISLTMGIILAYAICLAQSDADNGKEGELGKIYMAYVNALEKFKETKNISLLLEQIKQFATPEARQRIEKLKEIEDKETLSSIMAILKGVVLFPGLEIVNEIIEGDRGILRIQGFQESSEIDKFTGEPPQDYRIAAIKPIQTRCLATVFFKKEEGKWMIEKTMILNPASPSVFENIYGKDKEWMQYPCNFLEGRTSCKSKDFNITPIPDACLDCFAKFKLDASLCENISSDWDPQTKEIHQENILFSKALCRNEVARLTGDPKICENQPDREMLRVNPRKTCERNIDDYNYLPSVNIYTLDSDKDGLTDLLEIYFNTSIGDVDTDGDGKSDYQEVMEGINPLGEGKLGDHLK